MRLKKNRDISIAMVVSAIAIFFLGACKNDVSEVQELTQTQDLPLKVMHDVLYEFTDSAKKKIDLTAAKVAHFENKEPAYLEFDEGIFVQFYDKTGVKEASIKANYAKYLPDENLWEARGNVIAINKNNEELRTEELTWNQSTEKIYSNVFTTITTEESVLTGEEGFEADQNFEQWILKGSSNIIDLEEDEYYEDEEYEYEEDES